MIGLLSAPVTRGCSRFIGPSIPGPMDRKATYPASSVFAVAATVLFPSSGDAGGPARWCPKALRLPDACAAGTFHKVELVRDTAYCPGHNSHILTAQEYWLFLQRESERTGVWLPAPTW